MGKRTSYAPGTFSWVDLGTTDPRAAKAFYTELFGWKVEDIPVPDAEPYGMCRIDGESVAAIYSQPGQQREAGVPPNWFSYVTVESADEAAMAVAAAGGEVHAPPFDVMSAGRMAVIADPTGAMFGVWEPGDSIGATLVNEPGCLTWNDLATHDVATAIEFYETLFGWKAEPMDTGGAPPYWTIAHEGAAAGRNGGIRELTPEQTDSGVPPHWMPYFIASRVDEAVAKAADGGGAALFGPVDLPTGARVAVAHDPQGAIFGLYEGETDD